MSLFGRNLAKDWITISKRQEIDRQNVGDRSPKLWKPQANLARPNQEPPKTGEITNGNIYFVCVSFVCQPRYATSVTVHAGKVIRLVLKARDELSRLVRIVRVRSRVHKTRGNFPLASPDSYPGFKSNNARPCTAHLAEVQESKRQTRRVGVPLPLV